MGGRIFCRLSHVVSKVEYTCYCKTPILQFAVGLCRKAQRLAEKLEWMFLPLCQWALRQRFAVSWRCVCMMVPINGHRTNYVYMIDCTWSLLHTIQAEWLHIILPARLGYNYISYSYSENQKIWAYFCSAFKLLTPKCIVYLRLSCLPYSTTALSRSFCHTNSVSHIYTQTSCSYLYLVE